MVLLSKTGEGPVTGPTRTFGLTDERLIDFLVVNVNIAVLADHLVTGQTNHPFDVVSVGGGSRVFTLGVKDNDTESCLI